MGISGGGFGPEAHCRARESLEALRPAMAKFFNGEDETLRNLRASLMTCLPVKPEAPKIMTS